RKAVLADLALRAVVAHEEISASDEEVEAEIVKLAERMGEKVQKVRRDLDRGGLLETVRSDLARGKALQFLVDHAEVVDEEGNPLDIALDADALGATVSPDAQPDDTSDSPSDDPPEATGTDIAEGTQS